MPILLSILVLITIPGQLLRISLFDRIGVLPSDLIVLLVFVFGLISIFLYKKKYYKNLRKLFWPSSIFFLWAFISLIFSINNLSLSWGEIIQSGAYYFRYLAYFMIIFIAPYCINKKNYYYWKYLLFGSAFLISILGFLQLKFFPSFYDLRMHEKGWDPHIGRLLSTWFDPNLLGGYLVFVLNIMGGEIFNSYRRKKYNQFFYLSLLAFVIFLALVLTYSRSAYLALLISGFVFAFYIDKRLIIVGLLSIFITLSLSTRVQTRVMDAWGSAQSLFFQTEKTADPTSKLRIDSWRIGWKLFSNNKITGVGFNTLKIIQKREWSMMTKSHAGSGIDASLLTVASTTGIIGLISFLFFWLIVIKNSFINFKKTHDVFFMGLISGIIGIFIHGIFVNILFFNLFLPTLFLAVALSQISFEKSNAPKFILKK